ncbi:N-acetylglucosamine-6-phosphate deacetylase [Pichia kudriavzevii]|uniref:N-acetylglucosamine-6-phosphate deacetylase n=1 Tax=Pichia kudriavzevii TaxID=4909 RepID=A0A1V2LQJ2_PICKU|nr:putative N-acetylglucosamine-6-phosphate deacetylase [Pichia kudriavzevii]OUT22540.1 N-acetylglucosamine-6-phosphate deacetylase [Pichia kudriavzevii]
MPRILRFTNCLLADNAKLIQADLYVDTVSGVIIETPLIPVHASEVQVIDLQGGILSPGFIDIQINGCFGFDYSSAFNDKQDKQSFLKAYNESMGQLLEYGVTSICPTVTSSQQHVYHDVIPILGLKTRSSNKADSLGVHLEGPFISPIKKGCHPPEAITDMKHGYISLQERYGQGFEQYAAIVTAAPEVQGCSEIIPQLTTNSPTVFSIGHTMADFDLALSAVHSGATMITHLYNAMPAHTARDVGVLGLISATKDTLPSDKIPFYGIIADGVHVHPSAVRAAYMANPSKTILVTDALYLIGLEDGHYQRGNQSVQKKGSLLLLQGTDTIAGSATHLIDCVHNLIKWTGIPLAEALATITNNPATSLNIAHRKGFLRPGCDADLNILSADGTLKEVYKLGQKIHGFKSKAAN